LVRTNNLTISYHRKAVSLSKLASLIAILQQVVLQVVLQSVIALYPAAMGWIKNSIHNLPLVKHRGLANRNRICSIPCLIQAPCSETGSRASITSLFDI
jgi:hypothetical protein